MSSVSKRPGVAAKKAPTSQASPSSRAAPEPSGLPCRSRSVAKFQRFVKMIQKDPSKINVLLARALLNEEWEDEDEEGIMHNLLETFEGTDHGSECVFSYPDSDWFSVYLLDEDGEKVWDPEQGHMKLYFKIEETRNDAFIIPETMTNEIPDELINPYTGEEYENCKLSGTSCSGTRPKPPKQAVAPKAAAAAATGGKPKGRPPSATKAAPTLVPSLVSPVIADLPVVSISEGSSRPSGKQPEKITREFFEAMQSKAAIIDWMIKRMDPADLIKCIQKGALSPADVAEAEALAADQAYYPTDQVDEEVIVAAQTMPDTLVNKLLKRATKESIKEKLSKISDTNQKNTAIYELCERSGIKGYEANPNKKGDIRMYNPDGDQLTQGEIDSLLDKCASNEAVRLKDVIKKMGKQYARSSILSGLRSGKVVPPLISEVPIPQTSAEAAAVAITLESIISEIMQLEDPDNKKRAIVDLCERSGNPNGYYLEEKGGKLRIYNGDGDQVRDSELNDILNECGTLEVTRLNAASAFGKKRIGSQQNKFKMAAKKCKGKPNYRKCMSLTLKKKSAYGKKAVSSGSRKRKVIGGSKYVSKTRKSPESSATKHAVGYTSVGIDGNTWVIKKASNGVKRWVKK